MCGSSPPSVLPLHVLCGLGGVKVHWGGADTPRVPPSPCFPLQPHDLRAQVSTPRARVEFLLHQCLVEFFRTPIRPLGSRREMKLRWPLGSSGWGV